MLKLAVVIVLCVPLSAQQPYVGRSDAFAGFSYLDSGSINLAERGAQIQVGARVRRWISLGFDYSVSFGHTSLTPSVLTFELQSSLRSRIPPGYNLVVPLDSTTQTFAAGPQFSYHHWKYDVPFVRPSLGAIREVATPRPQDPVATMIVSQLAPSGRKTDWTGFYGGGGGFDLNFTDHVGIRVQADFVHDHLFNDLLNSRNTLRFSIGPAFQFGHNVQ